MGRHNWPRRDQPKWQGGTKYRPSTPINPPTCCPYVSVLSSFPRSCALFVIFPASIWIPTPSSWRAQNAKEQRRRRSLEKSSSNSPYIVVISSVTVAETAKTSSVSYNTAHQSFSYCYFTLLSIPYTPCPRLHCYPLARICIYLYYSETSALVKTPHFSATPFSRPAIPPSSYLHHPIISASLRCFLLYWISTASRPATTTYILLVSIPFNVPIILSYFLKFCAFWFSREGCCRTPSHTFTNRHLHCPVSLLFMSMPFCVSNTDISVFLYYYLSIAVVPHLWQNVPPLSFMMLPLSAIPIIPSLLHCHWHPTTSLLQSSCNHTL